MRIRGGCGMRGRAVPEGMRVDSLPSAGKFKPFVDRSWVALESVDWVTSATEVV